jgi:hypothetical protein
MSLWTHSIMATLLLMGMIGVALGRRDGSIPSRWARAGAKGAGFDSRCLYSGETNVPDGPSVKAEAESSVGAHTLEGI